MHNVLAWDKINGSPFEEVKVIEFNRASQWVLWVLSLLRIHVICDCKTKT